MHCLNRWEILPIDQFPRSEDSDFDRPNRSRQVERQRHVQQKENLGVITLTENAVQTFVTSHSVSLPSTYGFRERCRQAAPLTAGSPRIAGAPRDTMNRVRILVVMFTTSRNSKLRKAEKDILEICSSYFSRSHVIVQTTGITGPSFCFSCSVPRKKNRSGLTR